MTMMRWGRLLLAGGVAGAILSLAPLLLLMWLAPGYEGGFVNAVAILLTLSVTPFAALTAAVGAILLLIGVLRRDRQ